MASDESSGFLTEECASYFVYSVRCNESRCYTCVYAWTAGPDNETFPPFVRYEHVVKDSG